MPDIRLGDSITGSIATTDQKDANGNFYDDYTFKLTDARALKLKLESSSTATSPASSTLDLINVATGESSGRTSGSISSGGLTINPTLLPGDYKLRVSSLTSGNYKLSTVDDGKLTSIVSNFPKTLDGQQYDIGIIGANGQYFPGSNLTNSKGILFDIAATRSTTDFRLYAVGPSATGGSSFYNLGRNLSEAASGTIKNTQGNTLVGNINSLAVSDDNKIYTIESTGGPFGGSSPDKLYTVDPVTYTASLVGNLPTGFISSGDLVYDAANKRFFATSLDTLNSDSLWQIPVANPSGASKIGQIGFTGVIGLDLVGGKLIGFNNNVSGSTSNQLNINPTSGAGTIDKVLPGISGISGAATIPTLAATSPNPTSPGFPTSAEGAIGTKGQSLTNRTIDLTDYKNQPLKLDQTTKGDAAYTNNIGFYAVQDASGAILVNGKTIKPGDPTYAAEAVKSALTNAGQAGKNESKLNQNIAGGSIYAPVVIAQGSLQNFLDKNPTNGGDGTQIHAYFNYQGANTDGFDHFKRLSANTFAVEDQYGGGDRDFNDLIVNMNVKTA